MASGISARLSAGKSLSEARPEFYRIQQGQEESDPPGLSTFAADTTESVPALLRQVFAELKASLASNQYFPGHHHSN